MVNFYLVLFSKILFLKHFNRFVLLDTVATNHVATQNYTKLEAQSYGIHFRAQSHVTGDILQGGKDRETTQY